MKLLGAVISAIRASYSTTTAAKTLDSMPSTASTAIMYSRSGGLFTQYGTSDAELKTRVSDEAADDFRRLAREMGTSTSELLRLLVLTRLYGVEGVARMTRDHLARAAGSGPKHVP
jgi:hypothetical protein